MFENVELKTVEKYVQIISCFVFLFTEAVNNSEQSKWSFPFNF